MTILRRFAEHTRPVAIAVVIAFALAGSLAGLVAAQGAGQPPAHPVGRQPAQTTEPSSCGECHPDVVAAWQGGPHDLAYSKEHFQQGWASQDNDPACLACHTTGYSPVTGKYEAEGVTCKACHGDLPADHPPKPVDLSQANVVCAECHTVTQAEFRASHHAEVGMQCTSCHYAHSNGLRMETELQQCLNCHGTQLGGFVAHTTHIENGLSCRDCHGYVRPGLPIPDDGLGPTGHDFQESIIACLDCHEDIRLEAVNGDAVVQGGETELTAELNGQRAALRASQLEAAVQTLILQNRNQTAMHMIEGGVGGLLVGGLLVWLVTRRRNGTDETNGEEND